MTAQEGNKMIAVFMGWTIEPGMESEENPYYNAPYKPGYIPAAFLLNDLRFHSSWVWIMPVVEKIWSLRDIGVHISICKNTCNISTYRYLKQTVKTTTIEAIWEGVADFLHWYNDHKGTTLSIWKSN